MKRADSSEGEHMCERLLADQREELLARLRVLHRHCSMHLEMSLHATSSAENMGHWGDTHPLYGPEKTTSEVRKIL